MMRNDIAKKWREYCRIGLHVGLAASFAAMAVQVLYYALAAPVFHLFDGGRNAQLALVLTIVFALLIGLPAFGFIFSKLYPISSGSNFRDRSNADNQEAEQGGTGQPATQPRQAKD